jgi:hypothetical protein
MAEAFRETTVWKDSAAKNGVYLLEGDKCLAFRNFKSETTYFTKPITIDKRGRTFEKLLKIPFIVAKNEERNTNLVEVIGSKGETYYVDRTAKTCTCSGYKFRGTCKHLS